MPSSKKIKVKEESTKQRLDVFLSEELKNSRSQIQKMIKNDLVKINGSLPKKAGDLLNAGDTITIEKPKKIEKTQKVKTIAVKNPPVKIIADTPDYLVVEKPIGLLTHPTAADESNALSKILIKKYPSIKKIGEDPRRPGIVHRLDKDASGLLVVAKTQKMFEHLKKQFKNRTVIKEYSVLVHGRVEADQGMIDFPIIRSKNTDRMAALPKTKKGFVVPFEEGGGKEALTEFWVEKRFINFTLLKVKIHTGRTHQIRAHFLAYNHPLVGDPIYYQKKQNKKYDERLGRLFLHCVKLSFKDLDGKEVEFESDLPIRLSDFLKTVK